MSLSNVMRGSLTEPPLQRRLATTTMNVIDEDINPPVCEEKGKGSYGEGDEQVLDEQPAGEGRDGNVHLDDDGDGGVHLDCQCRW